MRVMADFPVIQNKANFRGRYLPHGQGNHRGRRLPYRRHMGAVGPRNAVTHEVT